MRGAFVYITSEITDRVNMLDAFSKYGFTVNRQGFIRCPFHKEKTASLKSYHNNRKFKCFGCGVGGSVIDFVMLLFDIDFRTAIVRINYDFGLLLPMGERISMNERRRLASQQAELQKKKEAAKRAAEEEDALYWAIFDKYRLYEKNKIEYAPISENEEWCKEFCEALYYLPIYEYLLDLIEWR